MSRTSTSLLLSLAFVSGAAALVYEVVFFRSLGLVFGVSVHAIAAVVGSFLLGLGLGAAVAGRRFDRFRPLRVYAAVEAAIALYGYASPFLFRQLRDLAEAGAFGSGATFQVVALALSFALLVLPTALMGATFPLLGRAIAGASATLGSRIGWLYGVNTLGACFGAILASYAALPGLGLLGTTHLAAGLNVLLAIAALLLAANPAFDGPPPPRPSRLAVVPARDDRALLCTVAAIGFASVALQVLANRLLIALLGGTVYVFGAILAVFLLGIALGGALLGGITERARSPTALLGVLALAFAGSIGVGVGFLSAKTGGDDLLQGPLNLALLSPGERLESFPPLRYFQLTFGHALVALGLSTFLAGAFLPAAIQVARRAADGVGETLGRVYLWNTVGSIAGSLAAAFVLLPRLGLRASMITTAILGLASGIVLLVVARRRGEALPAGWIALVTIALLVPGATRLAPGRTPGAAEGTRTIFHAEAAASAAKVCEVDDIAEPIPVRSLMVNGKTVASSLFIDRRLQLLLGFISTLAHRDPREVLCIGLGTGMTSGALAVAGGDLTIVELSPAVIEAARRFSAFNSDIHARADTTIVNDDGRAWLARCDRRFDVISADPIDPCVSGSAYLYTVEYYRLGKARLAPGGLMSQWIPLYDLAYADIAGIVKTFREVFPTATAWVTGYDMLLLGGESELTLDAGAIERRIAANPELREMLASIGVRDAVDLIATCFATRESLARFGDRAERANTDEDPWIEFHAPRAAFGTYPLDVYLELASAREAPPLSNDTPAAVRSEIEAAQRRLKDGTLLFVDDIRTTGSYSRARTNLIDFLREPRTPK